MKRPLVPAPPSLPRYPRLRTAWRLLAGAAPLLGGEVAFADTTLPPPRGATASGVQVPDPDHARPVPGATPVRVRLMGDVASPEPPRPLHTRQLMGKLPAPELVRDPPAMPGVMIRPSVIRGAPGVPPRAAPSPPPREEPSPPPAPKTIETPKLDGVMGYAAPPPSTPIFVLSQRARRGTHPLVLHPHDLDAPCSIVEWQDDDEA